ncbi:hypothetical protein EDC96DRAFT_526152 [Choanephora cucurbitarum]|nr:hypothetical protein EDC96DRAFT_526152 [Choanephora cucurbitarum]
MTSPQPSETLPRSRPSSIRRVRRNKDIIINSTPNSRPASRPSSRPGSRPTSRATSPTPMNYTDDVDQIIPTAIVIKNIPFSVKKDALLAKLASMDVPTAYAFNYHFDNGVFRGLAFANYHTPEEAEVVVNTVNGLDLGGRKLRVEYKKMLPAAIDISAANEKKERESFSSQPSSPMFTERRLLNNPDEDVLDLNDPNVLELYSYLLLFRGDANSTDVALPKTLSAKERRDAHLIADRLGLAHFSEGFGADRQVIIQKRGFTPAPIVRLQNKGSRASLRSSPSRERINVSGNGNDMKQNNASYRKSMMSTSTTAEVFSTGNIYPIRQPKGPEPGKNFASRNKSMEDQLADSLARQHLTHVGA